MSQRRVEAQRKVAEFRAALADLSTRLPAGSEKLEPVLDQALQAIARDFELGPESKIPKQIDRSFYTYRRGAQEFAGYVVAELDRTMEGDLSLRDQQILYDFRTKIQGELARRYPHFDLEAEALRHG